MESHKIEVVQVPIKVESWCEEVALVADKNK